MAYLIVSRVVHRWDINHLVPLATMTTTLSVALERLAAIGTFPNQIKDPETTSPGEIWFEVEKRDGELVGKSVCFPPEHAMEALLRTGMPKERAELLLSDAYALEWLGNERFEVLAAMRPKGLQALRTAAELSPRTA